MARTSCKARQYSDQMSCAACGLTWDVNDPEPPICPQAARPDPDDDRYVEVRTVGNPAPAYLKVRE